jgi:hypothetical protein
MSRAQRKKDAAALEAAGKPLDEDIEVHQVQVDTPATDSDPSKKVHALETLLAAEQKQLNEERQKVKTLEEEHKSQIEIIREAHVHEMSALETDLKVQVQIAKEALAEMVGDYEARIILGVNHIVHASEEAIALRVQAIPNSWGSKAIAQKILNEDYVHPNGIRDYYPVIDGNGHIVEVNGQEVKSPEGVAFRARAKKIESDLKREAKKAAHQKLSEVWETTPEGGEAN